MSIDDLWYKNAVVLPTNVPEGPAIRYDWRDAAILTLHNFSNQAQKLWFRVGAPRAEILVEVFDGRHNRVHNDGVHRVPLDPYAWRWYCVGAADNILDRSDLSSRGTGPATAGGPGTA